MVPEQFSTDSKYRMTFTDRDGKSETHYVAMAPDPKDPEKVKARLLETRTDLYLRGVKPENLHVEYVGPQSPADVARIAGAISGVRPVSPK